METSTSVIYTLSLHDALPISCISSRSPGPSARRGAARRCRARNPGPRVLRDSLRPRSEEHTSELQSQSNLVCRLLLEKKNDVQVQHDIRHLRQRIVLGLEDEM